MKTCVLEIGEANILNHLEPWVPGFILRTLMRARLTTQVSDFMEMPVFVVCVQPAALAAHSPSLLLSGGLEERMRRSKVRKLRV